MIRAGSYADQDTLLPGMAHLSWAVASCPGCGSADTHHDRNHGSA